MPNRAASELGLALLCSCSSSVHQADAGAPSDPKAPRGRSGGAPRPGGGDPQGEDPSDPKDSPRDPSDPHQHAPIQPNDSDRGIPPGVGPDVICVTPAVGPSPMRRLTHLEYDNSVRDLLGDTTAPGTRFAPDARAGLFDTAVKTQTVSAPLAEQYLDTAVALAEAADLGRVVGCDPSAAMCMRDFIAAFGRRAFRRPLESAEVDDVLATFDAASAAVDPETGARAVIAAFLASPKFIFRPEYGGTPSSLPEAKQVTSF